MNNVGKEVLCIKVPELNIGQSELYVGMTGLTIINEIADMYLLRNEEGHEGLLPKNCFKLIEELDIVDYLDSSTMELEEACWLADKKGMADLSRELERMKSQLGMLRSEIMEERM